MAGEYSVLIVEGDESLRTALRTIAVRTLPQAEVIESDSASDGMVRIKRQKFNLVITDINRSKAGGEGFLSSVRKLTEKEIPNNILVISGASEETLMQTVGRITYLSKPFSAEKLATFLKKAIAGEIVTTPEKQASGKIDVAFINPFIEGTLKVLAATCGTKAVRKEIYLRKSDQISGDISAIVAMNSATKQGSMAISFEKKVFLEVVSRMLGEEFKEITPEIQDAAAELCNQIFGYARKNLNEAGYNLQPAIPSIVIGDDHSIKHMVIGPCIAVKFSTDMGHFTVEAAFQA